MEKFIQDSTVKRFLNKRIRVPQRQSGTKLNNGVVVVISTFKNKQVIQVCYDTEARFKKPI